MKIEVTSNSSAFTKYLGKCLSKLILPGDLILFSGELGGGKTTFISGLAKGLGIKEDLSSPSFTILNIYSIGKDKKLIHADFYRLGNIDEIVEVGIEDYIYDNNSIVCIEWGEKIKGYLEKEYLEVKINYLIENRLDNNLNKRLIILSSGGAYWDRKIAKFKRVLKL